MTSREAALHIVYRVCEEGAYANLAANEVLGDARLGPRERALATEIAYTAIKAWNTVDWALGLCLEKKRLGDLPPWIRSALRVGAAQLLFLSRIPAHAALYETVELAKRYGHRGTVALVNAVLRRLLSQKDRLPYPDIRENPVEHIALRYCHPAWLVARWLEQFGLEETVELCEANNAPPPLTVRVNTLRVDLPSLVKLLNREGISAQRTRYAPDGLELRALAGLERNPAFGRGLFYVQDEASMLVGYALSPHPGSTVIDANAAPGGKTTHLAQLMGNKGTILAVDVHPGRLQLIEENCRRLGVTCATTVLSDAGRLGEKYAGMADYLLVDAPCSGLGVLRRRPDARWRKQPREIEELPALQLSILKGSIGCLKPGGVLVYSTCSTAPEENQEVLGRFLQEADFMEYEDLSGYIPNLPPDLKGQAKGGQVQFLPHRHGTDGFFIARLRRKN
ncbi:16S rRNA (cytosine(967)-C(5))-methyltransferase RsmB [Thermanaeromonas sp. C210]|uniref:16S rRNA (cytosine(967)-C(5))-methyltransferase RsmB n=1 Tax=Thermanaeromonas sp. C210 TaxID=2731925 RepID=UPI00155C3203|nr:16S rRNA (cytosine(967)-C(5))-methyltransferase RsmB [Thermanaeromonas sp. C210]GFN24020.1 ribosomal RNA small subunit methyltransferase B [Thermanaeromonas sp. C210]